MDAPHDYLLMSTHAKLLPTNVSIYGHLQLGANTRNSSHSTVTGKWNICDTVQENLIEIIRIYLEYDTDIKIFNEYFDTRVYILHMWIINIKYI